MLGFFALSGHAQSIFFLPAVVSSALAHACLPPVRRVAALAIRVGGALRMPPLAVAIRSCGRGELAEYPTASWDRLARVASSMAAYRSLPRRP